MSKPKLYVIAGPTASGKTAVAIDLAKKINGEIVSADSMQVYKYMNIGTAKPTQVEMDGIPHYLLDVVAPDEYFSVADYTQLATKAIDDILGRGRTPILAGGTGFYINAVIYGTEFTETEDGQHEKDNALRKVYINLAKEKGAEFIHQKLKHLDSESAEVIHPNNIKRVARAISFCESTGKLFSAHNKAQKTSVAKYDIDFNVLSMPREILYDRINQRTLQMWEAGLVEEVEHLLSLGYDPKLASMQAIGYKETIKFIHGEYTKEEAITQIQQSTRNYAKRQETWFRHQIR